MKTTIGKFDAATATVAVRFDHAGVVHDRTVNAVLSEAGRYDKTATAERVEEVALGVIRKIEIGAIVNAPPEPESPSED